MKSRTKVKSLNTHSESGFLIGFIILILLAFAISSCSDDNDGAIATDVGPVLGTYQVIDTYEDGEVKEYAITISKADDGVQISNFGKIMYVPVKAHLDGNIFTIPAQTFKGKTLKIVITGNGTLTGDKLNFNYAIDTGDGVVLEHTCVADKGV